MLNNVEMCLNEHSETYLIDFDCQQPNHENHWFDKKESQSDSVSHLQLGQHPWQTPVEKGMSALELEKNKGRNLRLMDTHWDLVAFNTDSPEFHWDIYRELVYPLVNQQFANWTTIKRPGSLS